MPAALRLDLAALTHKGMKRADNQDAIFAGKLNGAGDRYLFAVADGVGGREGGAWASERALQVLVQEMSRPGVSFTAAISTANRTVFEEASRDTSRSGAATTLVAVLLEGSSYTWANVGDSRAYLLSAGECLQLTTDHSLVEEEIAAGRLTREEAATSSYRNVITRSIGHRPGLDIDCEGPFDLDPSDVLLLCSDGLHGLVNAEEMGRHLLDLPTIAAAEALVQLANDRGGPDNVSVVLCAASEAANAAPGQMSEETVRTMRRPAQERPEPALKPEAAAPEPAPPNPEVAIQQPEVATRRPEPAPAQPVPVRRDTAPAQRPRQPEPRKASGPGFRVIGLGIAVGATIGILIGLLRPF